MSDPLCVIPVSMETSAAHTTIQQLTINKKNESSKANTLIHSITDNIENQT